MEHMKVYYDGGCYLCAHEIDLYRRKDRERRIHFVDISLDSFNAQKEGLDPKAVQKVFHVRGKDGKLRIGVDGFIAIWEEIRGLNFLARVARWPVVRFVLEVGYKLFVLVRPYLPRTKRNQCEDGSCQI